MDAVISQDAFGHASTEHHRAIKEAARVLKPGGVMAFSDFMQSDDADPTKLGEVSCVSPRVLLPVSAAVRAGEARAIGPRCKEGRLLWLRRNFNLLAPSMRQLYGFLAPYLDKRGKWAGSRSAMSRTAVICICILRTWSLLVLLETIPGARETRRVWKTCAPCLRLNASMSTEMYEACARTACAARTHSLEATW